MYQKKTEANMYQKTEDKYFQQSYIVKQIWKVDMKIKFSIFCTFIIFNLFFLSSCPFAILRFPWVSCSLLSLDLCHYFSLQHSQHYWLFSLTPIFYYQRHEINMNAKKYTSISSTILNLEVCDSLIHIFDSIHLGFSTLITSSCVDFNFQNSLALAREFWVEVDIHAS